MVATIFAHDYINCPPQPSTSSYAYGYGCELIVAVQEYYIMHVLRQLCQGFCTIVLHALKSLQAEVCSLPSLISSKIMNSIEIYDLEHIVIQNLFWMVHSDHDLPYPKQL